MRFLGLAILAVTLTGCCEWRAARMEPIQDHLESFVIVGANEPSSCPLPWHAPPQLLGIDESAHLWIRAVHVDRLLVPEPQKHVRYLTITEFGEVVTGGAGLSGELTTDAQGFARLPDYRPGALGTYRIRFDYADRMTSGASLSPQIIVAH